ncbi:MAG: SufD family Fe-S cluster assembly protein [Rickettsiales bacterium]|jgi:hypothetical protein|nr:SufD family Fe-S cluster assembly protein [Rickettsiales bacterium]
MDYLWDKFNIKTFPAHTIVFVDGVFQANLSAAKLDDLLAPTPDGLPYHIIEVGDVVSQNIILGENVIVFNTIRAEIKNPAFLQKKVENTGKNSKFIGDYVFKNYAALDLSVVGRNMEKNTAISIKTRVFAGTGSVTKLSGAAEILSGAENAESDISFAALCDVDIKSIEFAPLQKINSVPKSAEHSAAIWRPAALQIQYLEQSGIDSTSANQILADSFLA